MLMRQAAFFKLGLFQSNQSGFRLRWAPLGLALILSGLIGLATRAEAAETVVLRYGIFRGSVPVADLNQFAETGEAKGRIRRYLRLADQQPEQFQRILTETAATNPKRLELFLASPAGDLVLDELGRYIYAPDSDNRQNLRTAIAASAVDQQLSLLEVLQNYPTEKVHINVRRAVSTYQRFAQVQSDIDSALGDGTVDRLRELLQIGLPQ
ncbi:MAG: alpha/beta hydrolase [Elainella sp.]